jgi:hypothetical protein
MSPAEPSARATRLVLIAARSDFDRFSMPFVSIWRPVKLSTFE